MSPAKLIAQPPVVEIDKIAATVTIKRDNGGFMSALDGRFHFDGVHLITLSQGEVYTFTATPGKHTLAVKSIQPMMLVPIPFHREISTNFESGGKYEYIISPITSAGLEIVVSK
ncbi:hypothetical protein B9G39_09880 [Zooshikella ganghwensis]|uniref:DUF2846 domain-containing protein n=1 Tax=Zooshikella ganghwensis TaxID=202772 RepID=A0A4P9VK99_9GAMM|nr:hypothetical protein B9G39_09880 [Zooshikella ganghwensis]